MIFCPNLCDGTGEARAGQTKLKEFPAADLKTPRDSELEENLGAEVPTGSVRQQFRLEFKIAISRDGPGDPGAVRSV